ncbi:hypothetical protein L207DRAFT_64764 [Hyaloscypha variabilis F]|uniref:Uncharacterized protein n=1 Tax=Hyaloscypha variabilis (strain UAMH 11265 / GT02V1 / F) TaxID=1149755 RepID=A0A2J6RI99_HYAVF|nr:hypothetical protein L207DRAFT_64764 [Hyaloscypha variabilis F]
MPQQLRFVTGHWALAFGHSASWGSDSVVQWHWSSGPRLLDLRRVPRIPHPSCGCGRSVGQTRDEAADYWDPPIEDRGLARAWALPMARGIGHWAVGSLIPSLARRASPQRAMSHQTGPEAFLGRASVTSHREEATAGANVSCGGL